MSIDNRPDWMRREAARNRLVLLADLVRWRAEAALDAMSGEQSALAQAWLAVEGIPDDVFVRPGPGGLELWWAGRLVGTVGTSLMAELDLLSSDGRELLGPHDV